MASDPDDNPFARNSTWPKMPQAPFRVVALPKVSPQDREPEPEAPLRTITPLFVRPLAPSSAAPTVTAAPRLRPVAAPVAPPPPPPTEIELAPVIVQPYRKPRPKTARSPLPAIVATVVGLGGVIGLALLLSRAQDAALQNAAIPAPVAARVEPPAPVSVAAPVTPAPPVANAPPSPRVAAPRPRPASPQPAVVRPAPSPEVSAATDEMLSAPAISLTPPPPPVVHTPPPAVDPAAPVVTRAPYS